MACAPYASVGGSLIDVMVYTRLDIANVVGVLRRYMSTPGKDKWTTFKRIFWYLCGTKNYFICYQGRPRCDNEIYVHVFVDVVWVGDMV
jgi:hypothetical protein